MVIPTSYYRNKGEVENVTPDFPKIKCMCKQWIPGSFLSIHQEPGMRLRIYCCLSILLPPLPSSLLSPLPSSPLLPPSPPPSSPLLPPLPSPSSHLLPPLPSSPLLPPPTSSHLSHSRGSVGAASSLYLNGTVS